MSYLTLWIWGVGIKPCTSVAQQLIPQQGVLDLRQYDMSKPLALDGEWIFYYGAWLSNAQIDSISKPLYTHVPHASWSGVTWQGKSLSGFGIASYHLRVLLPKHAIGKPAALFSQEQSSAYQIFLYDKPAGSVGKIGTSAHTSIPNAATILCDFVFERDTLDILVHVSNFSHRKGGVWHSIELGTEAQVRRKHQQISNLEIFLFGALVLIGLHHLVIYWGRRSDPSALWFALMSLMVVVRLSTVGERYIMTLLPDLPWRLKYLIEYNTVYGFLPLVMLYSYALFPLDVHFWALRVVLIISGIFSLSSFLPAPLFTHFIVPFQGIILLVSVYILTIIPRILYWRRQGSRLFALSTLTIIISTVNDILYANNVINTLYVLSYGFLSFFFLQSMLLSIRFSQAFRQVEQLTKGLEQKVIYRTRALLRSNEELQSQQEQMTRMLELVSNQNRQITRKNANIQASLDYARRLQESLLPSAAEWSRFFPHSFILYQPMEIVSGDFYYLAYFEDEYVLALVDCTGHGVPGAFMSVLGRNWLDRIVKEQRITTPNEILQLLHRGVFDTLNQSQTQTHDGMDAAIIRWQPKARRLDFAGAKLPVYLFVGQDFEMIKGNAKPLGGFHHGVEREFDLHTRILPPNTCLYLFSDGFQDQIGGETGRKFMIKRFRDLLHAIQPQDIEEQCQYLKQVLLDWWGNKYEQMDDIMVIGIEL